MVYQPGWKIQGEWQASRIWRASWWGRSSWGTRTTLFHGVYGETPEGSFGSMENGLTCLPTHILWRFQTMSTAAITPLYSSITLGVPASHLSTLQPTKIKMNHKFKIKILIWIIVSVCHLLYVEFQPWKQKSGRTCQRMHGRRCEGPRQTARRCHWWQWGTPFLATRACSSKAVFLLHLTVLGGLQQPPTQSVYAPVLGSPYSVASARYQIKFVEVAVVKGSFIYHNRGNPI